MNNISIYAIRCTHNSKIYIGKTRKLDNRLKNHLTNLKNNKHSNKLLQQDFNKYGEKEFEFYLIENKIDYYEGNSKERYYMELYKTYDINFGYNKNEGYFRGTKMNIIKKLPYNLSKQEEQNEEV